MLSAKIQEALNKQIALEAHASFSYLSMASWCDKEGLADCAEFFYLQSDEERMHMLKIVHYVNEMDGHAVVPAVAQPAVSYVSVPEIFQLVYKQEQEVTASIHNILTLAHAENDHSTINFLQWYVTEQREEEAQVREILDVIRLIGEGPQSLYFINKELATINKKRAAAAAAEPGAGA